MVDNKFIQCTACEAKINLRIQLGLYNIPFHIQCPKCQSTIHGKVYIEERHIDIENAQIIEGDNKKYIQLNWQQNFQLGNQFTKKSKKLNFLPT